MCQHKYCGVLFCHSLPNISLLVSLLAQESWVFISLLLCATFSRNLSSKITYMYRLLFGRSNNHIAHQPKMWHLIYTNCSEIQNTRTIYVNLMKISRHILGHWWQNKFIRQRTIRNIHNSIMAVLRLWKPLIYLMILI